MELTTDELQITYTIADSKSGVNFLLFLVALVKAPPTQTASWYVLADFITRRRFSNGSQTIAISRNLLAATIQPQLNLIERLWGHLKRTVLANVLFTSLEELSRCLPNRCGPD